MAAVKLTIRLATFLLPIFAAPLMLHAQAAHEPVTQTTTAIQQPAESQPVATPDSSKDRPLPDVVAMMRSVELNQRKAEGVKKDYIFRSVTTENEVDSSGRVKKSTVTEADHYWSNGVPVMRVVRKNGKDLSPDEMAKENKRIEKEAAKAHERRERADAQGKETSPRGDDEITVSRLIELGAFTNPRRVQLNGRDTIAVDFTGDPKAKTRNRAEEVIRDIAGTAWIDERDHVLTRAEGHFVSAFKVGGGLLVNVRKDTRFAMQQTKVNDEVWLPAVFEGQGGARALLFMSFNGDVRMVCSDYRKFRATSTILPGATRVDQQAEPNGPAQP